MSRRTQKNVGIIGLGIIGQRVAETVRRRGFSVFVWNRTPRPFPNFVGSPSEIAQICDYIQIFVSDDEALLEVVQHLKQSLKAHHIVMAHSTVAPHTMRAAAEIVHRRGAQFLDAPFTGSKTPAAKGELVYYVGGDDAAFKRARPVLEASSKEIIEIGEIGQATLIKIATNIVTAATVQVAAEALALVHNAGLAPDTLVRAMRDNASNSGTLAAKLPMMIEGDFDPHFSVKHMLKDVQIATRLARSYGLTLGATETARDSLLEQTSQGRSDCDYSSLVRVFFPEGKREKMDEETSEAEEQPTLAWDEQPAKVREAEFPDIEKATEVPVPVAAKTETVEEPIVENILRSEEPEAISPREQPEVIPRSQPPEEIPQTGQPAATLPSEPQEAVLPSSQREVSPGDEQAEAAPRGEHPAAALWSEPPEAILPGEQTEPALTDENAAIDLIGFDDDKHVKELEDETEKRAPVARDGEEPPENDHAKTNDDNARTDEDLEPAVVSERVEKGPERRGFFSRMFGKSTDFEDSDY